MKHSPIYTLTAPQLINKFSAFYGTQVHYRINKSPPLDPTGKGKARPITCHKGIEGELSYSSTLSLTSALGGGVWSAPHPGRFTPKKESRYPLYRRLGGSQGRFGLVLKTSLPPGFDPRIVQPLASRYTDCDIPAHPTVTTLSQSVPT
jgi:rRNA maturation protein Nop10